MARERQTDFAGDNRSWLCYGSLGDVCECVLLLTTVGRL